MIKKVISDFSFEDYQKIAKDNTVKQGKVFSQGFLQNYNSKLPLVLYEYGILGGLQVSKPSPEGRLVTIRCAEFSKTPPNTTNLIVKYSVIREGKLITNKLTWKAQLISQ
ncbi:hypothetical protein QJU22_10020, partial [Pasteurella atlantica]|uniref:hypothetical protein n=2 Tax=Pasteurellales TaxID=135625 RepID=UPI002779ECB8